MEFETRHSTTKVDVAVELWDCSGDQKFESCWPAITSGSHGLLFVLNADDMPEDLIVEHWFKSRLYLHVHNESFVVQL